MKRLLLMLFVIVGVGSPVGRAHAVDLRAGAAVVVDEGFVSPIKGGNSRTVFSLALPNGAACPGDSVEGNYRVQSFLVPAATNPANLRYADVGPVAEHGWSLFMEDTNNWANVATQKADTKGGPGLIVNIPPFVFSSFSPGDLPPGRYHVGIACTLFGATKRYWSTDVLFKHDPDDKPAEIAWTVANPPTGAKAAGHHATASTPVLMAIVFVVLTGGGVVLSRRAKPSAAAAS